MTVLEGYSVKETALLLDRTPESVHNLRIEALQRLAELNPEMIVTIHPQESRLTPILLIRHGMAVRAPLSPAFRCLMPAANVAIKDM